MPRINRIQKGFRGSSLHGKIGLLGASLLSDSSSHENHPVFVFLVPDIVDNWIDMSRIEHGISDKEADDAQPEIVISKITANPGFEKRISKSSVATQGMHLRPSQRSLYRIRIGGKQKMVSHHFGKRYRQAFGTPDVLASADMPEPILLRNISDKPGLIHEWRDFIECPQMPSQRSKLAIGVV